jgi:hypothetical protein
MCCAASRIRTSDDGESRLGGLSAELFIARPESVHPFLEKGFRT